MRRKINYKFIEETASNLKTKLELLKEQQKKITKNIAQIKEVYIGQDADILVNKYNDKVKEMNVYIEVIEAYINYFDWLSGNYRDSHDKVTKNLNEIQNVIQGDFVPSNLKIPFEDGDYNV